MRWVPGFIPYCPNNTWRANASLDSTSHGNHFGLNEFYTRMYIFTDRIYRVWGRLCFHRCLSVHRGSLPLPRMHHWSHDQGGERGVSGQGLGIWSEGRRQTPPPQMTTAAVGTHPTGMHSCLFSVVTHSCDNYS